MPFQFPNPFRDKIAEVPKIKIIEAPLADDMQDSDLNPNEFYFNIRLCELYLRKFAEAGSTYVPRTLAITECLYGNGKELTLPVAVGEHILAEIGKKIDISENEIAINFSNCPLVGPMPYRGGDIGLFNGLYRVKSGNIADSVFDLVAGITGNLGINVGNYLDIGRQLTVRLPTLLGINSGDWRIAHYAPIYKENDSFFNRHLILVGEDGEDFNIDSLEICYDNSRESLGIKTASAIEPFNARDYILIKLDSRKTRGDYAQFGFHKRFDEVKKYLLAEEFEKAEWALIEQGQEIADCADLTEQNQLSLIAMYRIKIDQWKDSLGMTEKSDSPSHRGGADSGGDAIGNGEVAVIADSVGLPQKTVETLARINSEWDGLHKQLEDRDIDDFSDNTVNAFIKNIADQGIASGSATDLVDATKIHSLSHN